MYTFFIVVSINYFCFLEWFKSAGTPQGNSQAQRLIYSSIVLKNNLIYKAAGPTSLEDYFQKGALVGQKAALNLWYVDTRPNSQKLFPSI